MKILKDISELLDENIINAETAEKIKAYYIEKEKRTPNKLFVVFGVLGSLLIGLGIILIIAHNWDQLSNSVKSIFAFIPLIIGQLLCVYSIVKKQDSIAWKEASAVFLFMSVGASISLISQIYNIPGNINTFTLTWMLLCLPLVYLMGSSIISLFYLIGISYYNSSTNYWGYNENTNYYFWILILGILPHYYLLLKKNIETNFLSFHHWLIVLSIIIALGSIANSNEEIMVLSYMSLFGLLFIIGNLAYFENKKSINNAFNITGALGTVVLLIGLSFNWYWKDLLKEHYAFNKTLLSPEFISFFIISLLAIGLLFYKKNYKTFLPFKWIFILFSILFIIGNYIPNLHIVINMILLALGAYTIWDGTRKSNLIILNFGLLIISSLVIARFFDTNIDFIIRGIMFVLVGIGFLMTNLWMLKKRKQDEQK